MSKLQFAMAIVFVICIIYWIAIDWPSSKKVGFLMSGMDVTDLPPTFSYKQPQGDVPDVNVRDWNDYNPYPPEVLNMWDDTNSQMKKLI